MDRKSFPSQSDPRRDVTESSVCDGLDKDGFPGGDKRFNVWPTTFESAKQALLDFVPQSQRREYDDILDDVFMEMESEEESDEEE